MNRHFEQLQLTRNTDRATHEGVIQIIVSVQHGSVGGVQNQFQGVGNVLVTGFLRPDTSLNGGSVHIGRRNVPATITVQDHLVRVVAGNIFIADRTGFGGFFSVTGDSSVNTTVGNRARTIAYHDFELFLEHHFVRNAPVFQAIKESEYLRGNILPKQLGRVLVFTLVIMGLLFCVQIGSSQLGIGHIQSLFFTNTLFMTKGAFTEQIALSQIVQFIGSVNIVVTVELDFFLFRFGQRTVNVEGHGCFTNVHAKVSFNRFQGQTHLAIVHEIILVKENPALSQYGVFPPLMPVHDDKIVDRLNFFGREVTQNGFQDKLVIVLIVEPRQ